MHCVYPKIPRAGLGNMLIVWARARLFAHLNSLPMLEPKWDHIYIGPWLRGEKYKRYYGDLFQNKENLNRRKYLLKLFLLNSQTISNPVIKCLDESKNRTRFSKPHLFVFDRLPDWNLENFDYFQDLKEESQFIKRELLSMINRELLEDIHSRPDPQIGIHIRMGDFKPSTEFDSSRISRTSISWFIQVLENLRNTVGFDVPATVFTDGYHHEVTDILSMPNVTLSPSSSAISDMLTLSKSKIIIASSHSTFSAWGTYLGQCPTIRAPRKDVLYGTSLSFENSVRIYDGAYDPCVSPMPKLLSDNLNNLFLRC